MAGQFEKGQDPGLAFSTTRELDDVPEMGEFTDSVGVQPLDLSAAVTCTNENNAGYSRTATAHHTYAQSGTNDDHMSSEGDAPPEQRQIREAPWQRNWRHGYRGPLQTGYIRTSAVQDTQLEATSSARMASAFSRQPVQDFQKPTVISNPSFYGFSETPSQSTTPTKFTRGTMPKNFVQPLTCFYWYTYGQCSKADDECLYAHYYTGVVASGPVTVGGSKGPVAGRNAVHYIDNHTKREKKLMDWQAMLTAKEMELNGFAASSRAYREIEASIGNVHKTIAAAKASADNTRGLLNQRRNELAAIVSSFGTAGDAGRDAFALNAIDAAIEAVTNIHQGFLHLDNELEEKLGKRGGVPSAIDVYLNATG